MQLQAGRGMLSLQSFGMTEPIWSGKRGGLRLLPPLRTGRASYKASGSSKSRTVTSLQSEFVDDRTGVQVPGSYRCPFRPDFLESCDGCAALRH